MHCLHSLSRHFHSFIHLYPPLRVSDFLCRYCFRFSDFLFRQLFLTFITKDQDHQCNHLALTASDVTMTQNWIFHWLKKCSCLFSKTNRMCLSEPVSCILLLLFVAYIVYILWILCIYCVLHNQLNFSFWKFLIHLSPSAVCLMGRFRDSETIREGYSWMQDCCKS